MLDPVNGPTSVFNVSGQTKLDPGRQVVVPDIGIGHLIPEKLLIVIATSQPAGPCDETSNATCMKRYSFDSRNDGELQ